VRSESVQFEARNCSIFGILEFLAGLEHEESGALKKTCAGFAANEVQGKVTHVRDADTIEVRGVPKGKLTTQRDRKGKGLDLSSVYEM
jgi:endonuclease YncB( thermonuclease family)